MEKYTALRLWAVYFFVSLGGALGRAGAKSIPRQRAGADTRKSVCGAGFGERLTANNCSKKAIFLQLGIKTARRARKRGVFGIHKTNYVVKTTEFAERPRGMRRNWVFSGIAKRITLLKQRNSREIGVVRLTSRVEKARKRLRRGLWRMVSNGQLFKKAIFFN